MVGEENLAELEYVGAGEGRGEEEGEEAGEPGIAMLIGWQLA